jgi:3-oxoacyl-[acyl-carrier protein] reductase
VAIQFLHSRYGKVMATKKARAAAGWVVMKTNQPASKVAIVTGSSRGIGAAIARQLAAHGFKVIVNCAGRVADAESVVKAITEAGGAAAAIQADVSKWRKSRRCSTALRRSLAELMWW